MIDTCLNGHEVRLVAIHDKGQIRSYLSQVGFENFAYHCNNLEAGFWELTQWFGLFSNGKILATAMLSLKYGTPILLASCYHENNPLQNELLRKIAPYIPKKVYCHLDIGMARELLSSSQEVMVERFFNYKLADGKKTNEYDISSVQRLSGADLQNIYTFLKKYYPEYLLDEEWVHQGFYYAIKERGSIVSLAGVVAKSDQYKMISIGNVVTHPHYRGKKLASKTISALVHHLYPRYQHMHLNVKATNEVAIRCYTQLGFIKIGTFEEVISC